MSTLIEGLDAMVNEGIIKSYTVDTEDKILIVPRQDKVVYVTGMVIKDIKSVDLNHFKDK